MGLLITPSDFTGKYALSQDDKKLNAYIDKYEKRYLMELLGKELYDLFVDDVDSGTRLPVTEKYLKIYNSFAEEIDECLVISDGMKDMIRGFIFFEYVSDFKVKFPTQGAVKLQTEVSVEGDSATACAKFNDSVNIYTSIQRYIWENKDDTYPEFKGVIKKHVSFI